MIKLNKYIICDDNIIETCIICYEIIDNQNQIIFENCLHGNHVHYSCIKNWENTCPICRTPIYKPQNNYNLPRFNVIYNIIIYLLEIIINQYNHNIDVITYVITTR